MTAQEAVPDIDCRKPRRWLLLGALILMEANGVTDRNAGLANGRWFAIGEIGGVTGPFSSGLMADTGLGFRGTAIVTALAARRSTFASTGPAGRSFPGE